MAATTLISVEEYLSTAYHPDCDYVDGEILERNKGELEHSDTQGEILTYLRTKYAAIRRKILPEQRVQAAAGRFRIPDVCVLSGDAPRERIVRTPPALCIEILSKDDRMSSYIVRIDDYFRMGVPVCWIIDPLARRAWIATPGQLTEPAAGILRAGEIEMPLRDILEESPAE